MGNPLTGSVCNELCPPVPDPSAMKVDALSNELEGTVGIRIPTTSSVATGAREDPVGPVRTDPHCLTLAPGDLVPTTLRDVGTISTLDTQHYLITFRSTLPPVSVDPNESTLATSKSKWRIYPTWCNIQHINPLSATESVVSDFLLHLHTEKHLAISTIAGYQMAIASTLCATSGVEVGRNLALKSLLRNIEMEQGQHLRHFPEWNLTLVLSALTKPPFELLDQASDQLLTWKTVFLITFASGKCWGEIHAFERAQLQRTAGWTQVTLRVGLSFIQRCKC